MATQILKEFLTVVTPSSACCRSLQFTFAASCSHSSEISQYFIGVSPTTSVDAERLFSFSGGTVSKLCNQLSEHSAHAAVMVGQWAGHPDLIAAKEFEAQLVEGWLRKRKRKADVPAEGQSTPKFQGFGEYSYSRIYIRVILYLSVTRCFDNFALDTFKGTPLDSLELQAPAPNSPDDLLRLEMLQTAGLDLTVVQGPDAREAMVKVPFFSAGSFNGQFWAPEDM
ncbi:hypothetical protein B0H13DRAFT_1908993 [Mycena leptocephala]|nr:hypothetical protein B0H13DRAFT_1908993 [Mycena leptocephala]